MLLLAACTLPAQAPPAQAPGTGPARGATGVELLVFPDDDEKLLTDQIAAARERVFLKIYLLTDSRIIESLQQAQRSGADVRVLIEANPFGAGSAAKLAIQKLDEAGIPTKTANPIFRLTHEKSFVIDDRAVILTANMTRSSFTRNREFGIVHREAADVEEIAQAFSADWRRAAFEPQSPHLVWSPVNARERTNAVITGAQRELLVYAASSKDDEQIALLVQAQRRGVTVRVLASPPRAGDSEDADEPDLDVLQRGGVSVRYLKSPIVHAKAIVADGSLAYVGSINMSAQSLDFNRELGILLADQTALTRMIAIFEKDWGKAVDR
jgi:phosphatidylserine/phosphatidylglycerophosphate/cardiolipin synthase-like enzyme